LSQLRALLRLGRGFSGRELAARARHPGHVLSRRQLLQTVWGSDYVGDERVVDVHIGTLRKALRDAADPTYIETVRSIGYRLITLTVS
jgi:DNA-binding response OmpR family regulator